MPRKRIGPYIAPAKRVEGNREKAPVSFGKWNVLETIGEGGQGVVYLVYDKESHGLAPLSLAEQGGASVFSSASNPLNGRSINDLIRLMTPGRVKYGALKALHVANKARDRETAHERMQRELRILQSVSHPNIVALLDANEDERWFVTEYQPNGTLEKHLRMFKGKPFEALQAIRGVVAGVDALHRAGLVHRDIKPANIFLGNDERLVVGDLGIAFMLDNDAERLTKEHSNVGTRAWMPPWLINQRDPGVERTFDIYSLGKVLWAMIVGRSNPPVNFDPVALHDACPDKAGSRLAETIIRKCWVKEQSEEILDAPSLLNEIDASANGRRFLPEYDSLQIATHALSRPGPLHLVSIDAPQAKGPAWCNPADAAWIVEHPAADATYRLPGIHRPGEIPQVQLIRDGWNQFLERSDEFGKWLIVLPQPRSLDFSIRCTFAPTSLRWMRFLQFSLAATDDHPSSVDVHISPSNTWLSYRPDNGVSRTGRKPNVFPVPALLETPFAVVTRDLWDDVSTSGIGDDGVKQSFIDCIRFRGAFQLLFSRLI